MALNEIAAQVPKEQYRVDINPRCLVAIPTDIKEILREFEEQNSAKEPNKDN
jgi:hypothetical protein